MQEISESEIREFSPELHTFKIIGIQHTNCSPADSSDTNDPGVLDPKMFIPHVLARIEEPGNGIGVRINSRKIA